MKQPDNNPAREEKAKDMAKPKSTQEKQIVFNFASTGTIEKGIIEDFDLTTKEYLVKGVEGGLFIYGWIKEGQILQEGES